MKRIVINPIASSSRAERSQQLRGSFLRQQLACATDHGEQVQAKCGSPPRCRQAKKGPVVVSEIGFVRLWDRQGAFGTEQRVGIFGAARLQDGAGSRRG